MERSPRRDLPPRDRAVAGRAPSPALGRIPARAASLRRSVPARPAPRRRVAARHRDAARPRLRRRYRRPPFTYGVDPPTPPEPLHTLGTPLLLLAHAAVPSDAIELLLEAIFESRFARSTHPWLHRSVLSAAPRFPHHPGTLAYLERHRPFVTSGEIDKLNNSLGVAGALVGGLLFAWQWRRQRIRDRLDAAVGHYLLRVASLERRIATLELSASLELEPLVGLRRELLELKSEALERFASGDLGSYATITDLLTPINSARDQIAELILHVRENLEQQAEAEGRSADSVWAEAIEGGDEGEPPPGGGGSEP